MPLWWIMAMLPALMLTVATHAEAATATATLTVTANVRSGCSIENGSLNFGDYTAGQAQALDGTGIIRIRNCAGLTVTIELDGGSSGSVNNRELRSTNGRLSYQLYRDPARSEVWGTGNDANRVQILDSDVSIQVFGRIFSGQNVPAGSYTDTISVTMTF